MWATTKTYCALLFQPLPKWKEIAAVVVAILNLLMWFGLISGSIWASLAFTWPHTTVTSADGMTVTAEAPRWMYGVALFSTGFAVLAVIAGLRLQHRLSAINSVRGYIAALNQFMVEGTRLIANVNLSDEPLYMGVWPPTKSDFGSDELWADEIKELLDWGAKAHLWVKENMPEHSGSMMNYSSLLSLEGMPGQKVTPESIPVVYTQMATDIQAKLQAVAERLIDRQAKLTN